MSTAIDEISAPIRQYLDRHPYRDARVKANPGLSPYSVRHGYAYRGALAGIPLRKLAASMGHDVRTHMEHDGQWTDEAGLDAVWCSQRQAHCITDQAPAADAATAVAIT